MIKKNIKIGFISPHNPNDKKVLSGTPYKIAQSLQNMGGEVIWIPIHYNLLYKIGNKITILLNKIFNTNILFGHTIIGAYIESTSINKRQLSQCDLLFCPLQSTAMYSLNIDKPIIYLSDATFSIMIDYYFKNLPLFNIKEGNKIEQKAMDKADKLIFSSNWAANSAIKDYHQQLNKISIIEFGANIEDKDIVDKKFIFNDQLNLLFLGVDWERKGGDLAVEACKYLNIKGIPTTLYIIGIDKINQEIKKLPYINHIGFLNKNNPQQYKKLIEVITISHALILPTMAECSAIAFCESSANGLPIFSHDTGGVSNYVYNGKNGYLLPIGSTGKDFGEKILSCLLSGELEKMSYTAKEIYNEKLNWHIWEKKTEKIINELIQ